MRRIRISVEISDERIRSIVIDVLRNFKENIAGDLKKDEFPELVMEESSDSPHLAIVDSPIDIGAGKYILVCTNFISVDHLKFIAGNDVVGVVFKRNLEKEYEEKGKLEAFIKTAVRELMMMGETDEAKFSKKATWKFGVRSREKLDEIETASLFLDPSMKRLKKDVDVIVNELKGFRKILDIAKNASKKIFSGNAKGDIWKRLIRETNSIRRELENLRKIRSTLPSILITGPTGSGKTFLARLIAQRIFETLERFETVMLNTMEPNIVSGVIFGHRKGAYTDAEEDEPGILIRRMGDVIFLDEIGEIPPEAQSKLLHYLDSFLVSPLGLETEIPAPALLIAATNRDMESEIRSGRFRHDLYLRFRWKLSVPPLRDRKSDMRFLISFMLVTRLMARGEDPEEFRISYKAIERLENAEYRGNFRELERIVEGAIENALREGRRIILSSDLIS